MQKKSPIEINPAEFSHRASIYLLGVASAYHVTPDEALKVILEVVSKHMMPSFAPVPKQGRLTKEDIKDTSSAASIFCDSGVKSTLSYPRA